MYISLCGVNNLFSVSETAICTASASSPAYLLDSFLEQSGINVPDRHLVNFSLTAQSGDEAIEQLLQEIEEL